MTTLTNHKGVIFNGISSKVLNLVMTSSSRPLRASSNDVYIKVPFRDDEILVSDNSKNTMTISCTFTLVPSENPMNHARNVVSWLDTVGRALLVFEDDLEVGYIAKVGNEEIVLEELLKTKEFTVTFTCSPKLQYL